MVEVFATPGCSVHMYPYVFHPYVQAYIQVSASFESSVFYYYYLGTNRYMGGRQFLSVQVFKTFMSCDLLK